MDELEGGSEASAKATGNVVGHSYSVGTREESVVAAHLFLGQVGSVHGHDGTPLAFDETIGALLMGGSGDDRGVLGSQSPEDGAADELLIKVGVKKFRHADRFGSEIFEGGDDAPGG